MTKHRLATYVLVVCVTAALSLLAGCSPSSATSSAERGAVTAADGDVLAQTQSNTRNYPLGAAASPLVGSVYTQDAPEGIEQVYADDLLAGKDVQLTIDARIQQEAFDALGSNTGAVVVLDPQTGAVLAMASTPAYDPLQKKAADDEELANRCTELHIPGSTFKTITLAAALQSGAVTLDSMFPAPAELTMEEGTISNYDMMQYPRQTLLQAYAKSINTVFARIPLIQGFDGIASTANLFGFDHDLMSDFPLRASTICGIDDLSVYMQAWSGVGQALYQRDGELQGPVMSPVQGAVIAAAIANGGTVYEAHVVASVGGEQTQPESQPTVISQGFLTDTVVDQLRLAMRAVVQEGTGAAAAVPGVDVYGKTGTAETATGADDGWFIGFAEKDGTCFAFAVLVEGEESGEATHIASGLIQALFP